MQNKYCDLCNKDNGELFFDDYIFCKECYEKYKTVHEEENKKKPRVFEKAEALYALEIITNMIRILDGENK